ncbi:hypothetical protein [Phenylobacterium sp.]|uniref:hypothetical protein n=1 Tax=Phenylobacterium sp. TaxID=1871053 RepID=UPI0025FB2B9C|nr:hypothetical protein [Phenylobacterium sp.]
MSELQIVFELYPGVTHLDFIGPHQVLVRTPNADVTVASLGGRDSEAEGLVFTRLADLAKANAATCCACRAGSARPRRCWTRGSWRRSAGWGPAPV